MESTETVIVYAKRTPIGKMSGAFASTSAPMLGATLVKDALNQTGVNGESIEEIIMGNVLTAGVGQAPARQASRAGGLPDSTLALTLNKVCGSGLKAVMLADQAIRLGDASIVLAGGQENMTMAPHLMPNSRRGYKFGNFEVQDHMQFDGLWDPYNNVPMGNCGEVCAKEYNFSREEQDEYAVASYQRSRAAWESGHFAKEVVPVEVQSQRETKLIERDEEPFSVDLDRIPTLRPAFDKQGTVTAANASSINDGAALVMTMSAAEAKARSLQPIARIVAQAATAQEPVWFTTAPISAMKKVLQKAKLGAEDMKQIEINEAFAVVPMAAIKDMKLDPEKVNPFGGAVAIGHPIGASGARILVTLLGGLAKGDYGMASICNGGGEATALVVQAL